MKPFLASLAATSLLLAACQTTPEPVAKENFDPSSMKAFEARRPTQEEIARAEKLIQRLKADMGIEQVEAVIGPLGKSAHEILAIQMMASKDMSIAVLKTKVQVQAIELTFMLHHGGRHQLLSWRVAPGGQILL